MTKGGAQFYGRETKQGTGDLGNMHISTPRKYWKKVLSPAVLVKFLDIETLTKIIMHVLNGIAEQNVLFTVSRKL